MPGRELAVCVPYPYLAQAQAALSSTPIAWGAQDVSEHAAGAFTGEVSAAMLVEFGCRYAIVGHSERRQYYGDTDAVVAAKAGAALAAGLTPIACVGETLAEREAGRPKRWCCGSSTRCWRRWATTRDGSSSPTSRSGRSAPGERRSPEQAQAVHATLRARLARSGRGGRAAAVRRQRQGGQRSGAVRDGGYRRRTDRRRVAQGRGIFGDCAA